MMRVAVKIRDRGRVARSLRRQFNAASKSAWTATAMEFHRNYREKRFTEQHAREAGYAHRKGELIPRASKAFRASYTGRKLRIHGHTRPLEFSGATRRKLRFARITATSNRGRIAYSAGTFSFRPPKSKIRMTDEFTRITKAEAATLGEFYDARLDEQLQLADR